MTRLTRRALLQAAVRLLAADRAFASEALEPFSVQIPQSDIDGLHATR